MFLWITLFIQQVIHVKLVLTRGDVRHIAQDWNLSDNELETVMQRLDDAFEHGADVSVVHDVVRELMEEKRASRQVTVPAVMLEKVMALAGSEMKRLYAVGSENGGDGDAFSNCSGLRPPHQLCRRHRL